MPAKRKAAAHPNRSDVAPNAGGGAAKTTQKLTAFDTSAAQALVLLNNQKKVKSDSLEQKKQRDLVNDHNSLTVKFNKKFVHVINNDHSKIKISEVTLPLMPVAFVGLDARPSDIQASINEIIRLTQLLSPYLEFKDEKAAPEPEDDEVAAITNSAAAPDLNTGQKKAVNSGSIFLPTRKLPVPDSLASSTAAPAAPAAVKASVAVQQGGPAEASVTYPRPGM